MKTQFTGQHHVPVNYAAHVAYMAGEKAWFSLSMPDMNGNTYLLDNGTTIGFGRDVNGGFWIEAPLTLPEEQKEEALQYVTDRYRLSNVVVEWVRDTGEGWSSEKLLGFITTKGEVVP